MGPIKTILLTGANGYLGSNLVANFAGKYRVIGVELQTSGNFRLANFPEMEVVSYSPESLNEVFEKNKIDLIIHTATRYGRNNESALEMLESNVHFPLLLLELASKYRTPYFINTDTVLERSVNNYALTKAQCVDWLMAYSKVITCINIKLEHFYGPGAPMHNFITRVFNDFLEGKPSVDFTPGMQKRDFVYISDVVAAFNTIVLNLHKFGGFATFGVTTGKVVSLKEIIVKIKDLTQSPTIPNFGGIPYREGELMESSTNNSQLLKLGWQPLVSIDEGLRIILDSLK
jgi:nucleoside-diphosphate-sugar epimerase